MDREYLEDYKQKEKAEYERFLRRIQEGKFSFEKDKHPPNERFVNIKNPVAFASYGSAMHGKPWAQIPFTGSLIIHLPAIRQESFESQFFEISEIPRIIDFVKETGKLQVILSSSPLDYEGLDYLDPFFKELNPPWYSRLPLEILGTDKQIKTGVSAFETLGRVKYLKHLIKSRAAIGQVYARDMSILWKSTMYVYIILKLGQYSIVEKIENLMIDDPAGAELILGCCGQFIAHPAVDLRSDLMNYTLEEIQVFQHLPLVYQPKELRFPSEIGMFLTKKLTYAPRGLRACNNIIDEYKAYDVQKVVESLNKAIVTNHPNIVKKRAEEFSEILDNIWADKTIPRRVKGLQIGIPLSTAAIGSVAAGPIGAAGGFLAGLGYSVADRFIDLETEGLSERIAKLKTKSYQANIYDFKEKYKAKIVH